MWGGLISESRNCSPLGLEKERIDEVYGTRQVRMTNERFRADTIRVPHKAKDRSGDACVDQSTLDN